MQKSQILHTLQDELANADELEGVGEILESITKFMDTYKRRVAGSNIIDLTQMLDQILLKENHLSDERRFGECLDHKLLTHLNF